MTILEALLGQATAGINRTVLLTGGIPASILVLGWHLYEVGIPRFREQMIELLKGTAPQIGGELLWFGLLMAATAGVFVAGRSLVLRSLQAVPGVGLSILRRHLLEVQVSRWWNAHWAVRRAEARLTPVNFICNRVFASSQPSTLYPPQAEAARRRSHKARALVARLSSFAEDGSWSLERSELDVIVAGLQALFTLDAQNDGGESRAWRDLLETPAVRDYVQRIHATLFREVLALTARQHEQPEDDRWLTPTRLGNRVASLDDYAERRYGIETSSLWLRLWGVLTAEERKSVADAQVNVEALANIAVAFGVLAAAISVGETADAAATLLAGGKLTVNARDLGYFFGIIALMSAAYRSCVYSFGAVAEHVVRLIDFRRLRLITALGYEAPKTVAEELDILRELRAFFSGTGARRPYRSLGPTKAESAVAEPEA